MLPKLQGRFHRPATLGGRPDSIDNFCTLGPTQKPINTLTKIYILGKLTIIVKRREIMKKEGRQIGLYNRFVFQFERGSEEANSGCIIDLASII